MQKWVNKFRKYYCTIKTVQQFKKQTKISVWNEEIKHIQELPPTHKLWEPQLSYESQTEENKYKLLKCV